VLRQLHDITILVEDNGRVFKFAVAQEKGGQCFGLMGMKERVNLLGGDFVIESALEEGTTIRVQMPVSEDRDANTDLHS
jgi:two-component system sensor histidine kinase DegS